MKPILVERYADNGQLSHYELIDDEGNVLWTQSPESPSPSLQAAAEESTRLFIQSKGINIESSSDEYRGVNLKLSYTEGFIDGWNAREAQQTGVAYESFEKKMSIFWNEKYGTPRPYEAFEYAYSLLSNPLQRTGLILTRELHDKIWEAATKRNEHKHTQYRDAFNFTLSEKTIPDKETFYKSLNL